MIAREPIEQYLTQQLRENALKNLRDSKGKKQGPLALLTNIPVNLLVLLERMPESITHDTRQALVRTAEIMSMHPRDAGQFAAGFFARQTHA